MKKLFTLILLTFVAAFIFTGCEKDGNTGTLHLSITDAPVDNFDVVGVWLTISEIQYHMNDNEWMTFEEFEGPQEFNILELTNGESELLGSFEMEAGTYTQLRFILEAPDFGGPNPTNPGCYIEFTDESTEPLFVPSGHQSGWKAVGQFKVPSNGDVSVTADFDARKSVLHMTGAGRYILKPTIRLIVDNQSGQIAGGVSNIPEGKDIVIYAYEDGTYTESEADEPADEETPRFPNAITSSMVCDSDSYHLSYLAPGTYDLVVTSSVDGEFEEVLGIVEDVVVESRKTTNMPIDISAL
ncbi:MAG: DUF4382 domain-containing protein [Bacteroidota bacterium]|nr:DUF4382 domain-containing protein [Bacteroidota bacterium]